MKKRLSIKRIVWMNIIYWSSMPYLALAASATKKDVSGMLETVTTQVDSVKNFAILMFFVAGLILIGLGAFQLKKASQEEGRDHGKKAAISFFVALILLSVGSVATMLQESTNLEGDGNWEETQSGTKP